MKLRASTTMVLALCASATAQKVSDPILIYAAPSGHYCVEATIAVTLGGATQATANRVACAFIEADQPDHSAPNWYRVRYATTSDGWATRFTELLPLINCSSTMDRSTDPMCASTTNGELLIGALGVHFPEGSGRSFSVGLVPLTSPQIGSVQALQCRNPPLQPRWDKGWLASGPSALINNETRSYLLYSFGADCSCITSALNRLIGVRAIGSSSWGTQVPEIEVHHNNSPNCEIEAQGAFPLVIPGGTHRGRVVVPYRRDLDCPPQNSQIEVLYSDTECLPDSNPLVEVWQPPAPIVLNRATGPSGIEVITQAIGETLLFPAAAVDPVQPDLVYVIFTGHPTAASNPSDLYIAWSLDGGTTFFPSGASGQQTLRLTDAMLGDPEGTEQTLPAICVDSVRGTVGPGGVGIFYYAKKDGLTTPRFAWIKGFQIPLQGPIFAKNLSAAFPDVPNLRDYYGITAKGCTHWPIYVTPQAVSGQLWGPNSVWTNRITVCDADSDFDGVITSNDPLAFASQYIAQSPDADLNGDAEVGPADVVRFQESYACGCGAP